MKIKIKSREEIEKGVGYYSAGGAWQYKVYTIDVRILMTKEMIAFCEIEEAEVTRVLIDRVRAFNWYWHKDWYEVVEPDFTEEDLMDIELMDEMLA